MMTDQSQSEGTYAWSNQADNGTVVFQLDVPCEDTYYVWGVVWDAWPGAHGNDPDSFYAKVDDGNESQWIYGCQTGLAQGGGWFWLPVIHDPDPNNGCDDIEDQSYDLPAGKHSVTLRNREWPSGNSIAAVARVLVTNDENLVPDLNNY
jgi:hypothetical protein